LINSGIRTPQEMFEKQQVCFTFELNEASRAAVN
jgi:hypothetical protein